MAFTYTYNCEALVKQWCFPSLVGAGGSDWWNPVHEPVWWRGNVQFAQ